MLQAVVVVSWFVNSASAHSSPCHCDGFSFLSKAFDGDNGENPCGCNFVKVTPRRELTSMTNGQLEKMASGLQAEVDELQSTLEGYQKGNGEKLADLKKKLATTKEQKKKKEGKEQAAVDDRQKTISDLKKTIGDDEADIADINEELKTNQMILKEVRTSIALRMEDVHACGCEKLKEDGGKASLVTKSRRALEPDKKDEVDYDLVFKIEKLERSKASINKDITKEQSEYGWKSRDLMERTEEQTNKINLASSGNDKYKRLDDARLESVIAQRDNIKRQLERKTAQLKQVEKDANEAQKHYDNLEAEMKICGCEPPSDTVLEMRKFKLDNR